MKRLIKFVPLDSIAEYSNVHVSNLLLHGPSGHIGYTGTAVVSDSANHVGSVDVLAYNSDNTTANLSWPKTSLPAYVILQAPAHFDITGVSAESYTASLRSFELHAMDVADSEALTEVSSDDPRWTLVASTTDYSDNTVIEFTEALPAHVLHTYRITVHEPRSKYSQLTELVMFNADGDMLDNSLVKLWAEQNQGNSAEHLFDGIISTTAHVWALNTYPSSAVFSTPEKFEEFMIYMRGDSIGYAADHIRIEYQAMVNAFPAIEGVWTNIFEKDDYIEDNVLRMQQPVRYGVDYTGLPERAYVYILLEVLDAYNQADVTNVKFYGTDGIQLSPTTFDGIVANPVYTGYTNSYPDYTLVDTGSDSIGTIDWGLRLSNQAGKILYRYKGDPSKLDLGGIAIDGRSDNGVKHFKVYTQVSGDLIGLDSAGFTQVFEEVNYTPVNQKESYTNRIMFADSVVTQVNNVDVKVKYLFQSLTDNYAYTFEDGAFVRVRMGHPPADDFMYRGLEVIPYIDKSTILGTFPDGKFKLLAYDILSRDGDTCHVGFKHAPDAQLALMTTPMDLVGYEQLNTVSIRRSGSAMLRAYAVSRDGVEWFVRDGSNWVSIGPLQATTSDADQLLIDGMSEGTIESLNWTHWEQLYGGLPDKFYLAVAVKASSFDDTSSFTKIEVNGSVIGHWKPNRGEVEVKHFDNRVETTTKSAGLTYKVNYQDT